MNLVKERAFYLSLLRQRVTGTVQESERSEVRPQTYCSSEMGKLLTIRQGTYSITIAMEAKLMDNPHPCATQYLFQFTLSWISNCDATRGKLKPIHTKLQVIVFILFPFFITAGD